MAHTPRPGHFFGMAHGLRTAYAMLAERVKGLVDNMNDILRDDGIPEIQMFSTSGKPS